MRIPHAVLVVAMICAGSRAEAQTMQSIAPRPEPSTETSQNLKAQMPLGGVEVLSDTAGVDFGQYLLQWHRITKANWHQPTSKEMNAQKPQVETVAIRFKIVPNGQLMDRGMVLEERSGQTQLDKAAWDAIANSDYPRLPEEFHGPYLELRAYFSYRQPAK